MAEYELLDVVVIGGSQAWPWPGTWPVSTCGS